MLIVGMLCVGQAVTGLHSLHYQQQTLRRCCNVDIAAKESCVPEFSEYRVSIAVTYSVNASHFRCRVNVATSP
jgi:hypothetical protein